MAIYHRHKLGQAAEKAACAFLTARGLTLIAKNFRTKLGEIDLIMQDGETIVFVEVRSKQHGHFGTALESIEATKEKKLNATATLFLQQKGWLHSKISRFDVVGIDIHQKNTLQFDWVKNAF